MLLRQANITALEHWGMTCGPVGERRRHGYAMGKLIAERSFAQAAARSGRWEASHHRDSIFVIL